MRTIATAAFISGTTGSAGELGDLCTLLEWHQSSPPDTQERARGDAIFTDYQRNRNLFVDRPEFATALWGSQY